MTYREAEKYILDIPKFTKKNDLGHTKTFLKYLGNPQKCMKVLHVAGTNGKGSVCVYLDTMLRSEEKRTGLFVSPHLVRMNERIVIDGLQISDEEFICCFEKTLDAVRKMAKDGLAHPTFFEFLFGMAMTAFASAGVEYAVLETGLGGRLDATTAVESPLVCAITSIGLDHVQYLGNTIEQIASEKAGIILPGVPVFYSETSPQSDEVIEKTAQEKGSFCKKIGKDAYEILGIEDKHIAFSCASDYYGNTTWKLNNIGVYQPGNAMLAMEVMRYLFGGKGHPEKWREALSKVKWAGRMEEIIPGVYIDGAHNVSAAEAFVKSIPADGRGSIILFSAVKDKDYDKMAECICSRSGADMYVVTHIDDPRGEDIQKLKMIFQKYTDRPVIAAGQLKEALKFISDCREGRRVYCIGSLYLAGMIRKSVQEVL